MQSDENSCYPKHKVMIPKQQVMIPKQQVMIPKQHVMIPKQKVMTPKQQVMIPKQTDMSPKQKVMMYIGMMSGRSWEVVGMCVGVGMILGWGWYHVGINLGQLTQFNTICKFKLCQYNFKIVLTRLSNDFHIIITIVFIRFINHLYFLSLYICCGPYILTSFCRSSVRALILSQL